MPPVSITVRVCLSLVQNVHHLSRHSGFNNQLADIKKMRKFCPAVGSHRNSGSNKWPLAIRKNLCLNGESSPSLSQLGEHHTARLPRHWSLSHSPLQGESMSSCVLSSEIILATKCNSGSNKWSLVIWKNLCLNRESNPSLSLSGWASYS